MNARELQELRDLRWGKMRAMHVLLEIAGNALQSIRALLDEDNLTERFLADEIYAAQKALGEAEKRLAQRNDEMRKVL